MIKELDIQASKPLSMMIFSRKAACMVETKYSGFGEDPHHFVDPGSFSGILYHEEIGHKLTFCNISQHLRHAI